jgi:small conductance mechanosensitive channel
MDQTQANDLLTKLQEYLMLYGLKFLAAIAIFVLGRWAAGLLARVMRASMDRAQVEATLASFVSNLIYFAMLIFVIIASLGQLGLQTTSFVALIGAAGLAIGLALQGSLSNFASGVLIIVFHPFGLTDHIEAAGTKGTVREIQIFHTVLALADGRKQIVPNSAIMSGTITVGLPKP